MRLDSYCLDVRKTVYRVSTVASMAMLLSLIVSLDNADAAPKKPDAPVVRKISSKITGRNLGTITVRIALSSSSRKSLFKTEVKIGNQFCTMRKSATKCSIRNVKLGSSYRVQARSQNKFGFSRWSASVQYLNKAGNVWTDSSTEPIPNPISTTSTTFPVLAAPQTATPSTSSSTSSTTTTTLPYCLANPVPLNQLVFGRAWLSGGHWNVPGVEQASRYGAYPSANVQPSRCQFFGFTGIQARPTNTTVDWWFVAYTLVTSSFSTYARVSDSWGVNMDFRYVYEIYNMSSRNWEIRYVWYSPYSCGYTCEQKSWLGLL